MVMTNGPRVVVEGDIAVIASEDAIFDGHLSQAQRVGALVKSLKAGHAMRALTEMHKTTYGP